LDNTTINSQTPNSITDLYNQYMILISWLLFCWKNKNKYL
jgi:hypothetical protein